MHNYYYVTNTYLAEGFVAKLVDIPKRWRKKLLLIRLVYTITQIERKLMLKCCHIIKSTFKYKLHIDVDSCCVHYLTSSKVSASWLKVVVKRRRKTDEAANDDASLLLFQALFFFNISSQDILETNNKKQLASSKNFSFNHPTPQSIPFLENVFFNYIL